MKDLKTTLVKHYINYIWNNDQNNTILEAYAQTTKKYDYLDVPKENRKEYLENVILKDVSFLKACCNDESYMEECKKLYLDEIIDDLLNELYTDPTEDEKYYILYKLNACSYDDYLAICDIEECEPKPRKKWKVNYTMYDNNEWIHFDKEEIIEADSFEEVKKIIKDKGGFDYECFLERAKEIED